MDIMDRMMDAWLKRQSPQQKRDMMAKMMPKMMENMKAEDMMAMMSQMMPQMMKMMGGFEPGKMREMMSGMMPEMMENCLTQFSEDERQKMLSFCHSMLGEMGEKFGVSAEKEETE